MARGNSIYAALGTTVFEVMSRLARDHGAVNLGQGFPDGAGPPEVMAAAAEALSTVSNQYPPMMGLPALRQAVARHEKRFHGLDVDPDREVMVTSGATEALADCLLSMIEPGDEVVLFQPMYDSYLPMVRRAGGVPRFVTLRAPDWRFTRADLEAVFGTQTRVVLLNNPLNPAAKVFPKEDLELLAEFVIRADAVVVCDEVYEHIAFGDAPFTPMRAIDGMADRCLKIGSAGKTFSLTGWKIGYVTAAPELLGLAAKAHQFLTFTTPPSLQAAVAVGLDLPDAYYQDLGRRMVAARDHLTRGLRGLGLEVLPCDGTYFLNVDTSGLPGGGDDVAFCERMITEAGVAAIPISAFYAESPVTHVVRFCFAKETATLDAAIARLSSWLGKRAA